MHYQAKHVAFAAAISAASFACLYWLIELNWLWVVTHFPGWASGPHLMPAAAIPGLGYLCGRMVNRPLTGTAIAIFLCVFIFFGLLAK